MVKILVVDDEADLELLIKQKFRKKIREQKYEFYFAPNGIAALLKIKEHPDLDIVLSDINMPEMDGLTLLTKISAENPILKAVMVSAYGDMENIRSAMNRGAFDFVCKPVDFEDLELTMEKTVEHVNQLRQTVQAIKENNILKLYVDESVLQFMTHQEFEAGLVATESIEATVMYIDICGFTGITERVPAKTVINLLNTFFERMVQEIIAENGHVDKFMGDAVMAVFRGEQHLDRAIKAALAVNAYFNQQADLNINDFTFQPRVSIGINAGEMVSGNIGSASLRRLDYTVIGDTVNVAQRLQSIAKPGQIVVTEKTYQQASAAVNFNQIGQVNLKNKAQPVTIYEVTG